MAKRTAAFHLITLLAAVTLHATEPTPAPSTPVTSPATSALPPEIVISVPDQQLAVIRHGQVLGRFPISTSKFGLGDTFGSYKTPLGEMRICEKVGAGLPLGAVLKNRHATGEVLPVNAPGRDPIVTRILCLEGLEARNEHARERRIYIHGTPEERRIGQAVSWGCIRMRSRDIVKVFDWVSTGTPVRIETEKLSALVRDTRNRQIAALQQLPAGTVPPVAEQSPDNATPASTGTVAQLPQRTSGSIRFKPTKRSLLSGSILDYNSFEIPTPRSSTDTTPPQSTPNLAKAPARPHR